MPERILSDPSAARGEALRCGHRADGTSRGTTLWGRMDRDATLLRVGAALEEKLDLWSRRPALG